MLKDAAMQNAVPEISGLIARLYEIVEQLESIFPGRSFTPDGHLVGSIGEAIAATRYELSLVPMSTKGCDATSPHCERIEIKATQGDSVAFNCDPPHLIVLKLTRDGDATEVFNGPGDLVQPFLGPMQKNGQRVIRLKKLRELQTKVRPDQRLPFRKRS
jgi:hypothetical protein